MANFQLKSLNSQKSTVYIGDFTPKCFETQINEYGTKLGMSPCKLDVSTLGNQEPNARAPNSKEIDDQEIDSMLPFVGGLSSNSSQRTS